MRQKIIAVLKMSRGYFLPMPVLPYLIGVGLARQEIAVLDTELLWFGLLVQLCVQLSISYLNDYWDIETDRINQNRTLLSGGSGELTTGILKPEAALYTGILLQSVAILIAIFLRVSAVSWILLSIAIAAAHFYTAPPLKLVYRSLGELTTGFTCAILVPMWGYSLQTNTVSRDVLLVCLPLLPFVMGMMLGIATPDVDSDRQVNKITLAVRVGEQRIAALYAGLMLLGYLLAIMILPKYLPFVIVVLIFMSLPLALWAWLGLRNPVKSTSFEWLWMVARPALVASIPVVMVTLGVWVG